MKRVIRIVDSLCVVIFVSESLTIQIYNENVFRRQMFLRPPGSYWTNVRSSNTLWEINS